MHYGNNGERAERLTRRNRALEDEGGCSWCRPHRGENQRGKPSLHRARQGKNRR